LIAGNERTERRKLRGLNITSFTQKKIDMKQFIISIASDEVDFFKSIGIAVINRDSEFRNQAPGEGYHWVWVMAPELVYKYYAGGEENPMTGFSSSEFLCETILLIPKSAFTFGVAKCYFGDWQRRIILEPTKITDFCPEGAADGLRPTLVSKSDIDRINDQYWKFVTSLLVPGKSREWYPENKPLHFPAGLWYDPVNAVENCNPATFPFNK